MVVVRDPASARDRRHPSRSPLLRSERPRRGTPGASSWHHKVFLEEVLRFPVPAPLHPGVGRAGAREHPDLLHSAGVEQGDIQLLARQHECEERSVHHVPAERDAHEGGQRDRQRAVVAALGDHLLRTAPPVRSRRRAHPPVMDRVRARDDGLRRPHDRRPGARQRRLLPAGVHDGNADGLAA